MAKIVKMNPDSQSEDKHLAKLKEAVFKDFMTGLSEKDKKFVDSLDIQSLDDIFDLLALGGMDPLKVLKGVEETDKLEDFLEKDFSFDEDDPRGALSQTIGGMFNSYMPRNLFLDDKDVKEYHIRIKLNNSPVKIWRELKVPSNISLEYLASALIQAMGWLDEHLHQFKKNNTYYKSTEDLEQMSSLPLFQEKWRDLDANDYSLAQVLTKKGDRILFEYDFGDSWQHDVWVKNIRDYEPEETPNLILVKGQGACPPENCGGVWGYAELLELKQKKRKTNEDKETLEWYDMNSKFDPEEYNLEEEQLYFDDTFGVQG